MTPTRALTAVGRLAVLFSLQGAGQVLFALLGALLLPMQFFYAARAHRVPSDAEAAFLCAWPVVLALGGLASLRASRLLGEYRGRRLALLVLAVGVLTCPTGLLVLAYGLWCLTRADVKVVLERGESGASVWDVEHGEG